jgi:Ca2+-binding RTX toxin-like protein
MIVHVETLEPRQLFDNAQQPPIGPNPPPTPSASHHVANNTLYVVGTSLNDTIKVTATPASIEISALGGAWPNGYFYQRTVQGPSIDRIVIYGYGGNDQIEVLGWLGRHGTFADHRYAWMYFEREDQFTETYKPKYPTFNVYGGFGNDTLIADWAVEWAFLDGGPGADHLDGRLMAVADYSGRSQPVSVNLFNDADDGEAGEHDWVDPAIRVFLLGSKNDVFQANSNSSRPYAVFGGSGNDWLLGGGGDDFMNGELGNDYLIGYGGKDYLIGWDGADTLDARDGAGGDHCYSARLDYEHVDEYGDLIYVDPWMGPLNDYNSSWHATVIKG